MTNPIHSTKNIIFDLGGVLLNLNIQKSIDAFVKLGHPPVTHIDELVTPQSPFGQLERGEISPEDFIKAVHQMLPATTTPEQVEAAWCAMLLEIPENRILALKKLKQTHRLFLYSNTNAIHARYFESKFHSMYDYSLHQLFEKIYYSHEIGFRKPSVEGFQQILVNNSLIPSETLFVDDLETNLTTAQKLGMKTLLIDPRKGFSLP